MAINDNATHQLVRQLHTLMNADELSDVFGVSNSSGVLDSEYEVIYIRQHRPPQKRDGGQQDHAHYSFTANKK